MMSEPNRRFILRQRVRVLLHFLSCQAAAAAALAAVAAYSWWQPVPSLLIAAGLCCGVAAIFWHLTWKV